MDTEKKYGPVFRFVNYSVYQDSKKWMDEVLSLKGVLIENTELWPIMRANVLSVVMNITSASTKLSSQAKQYFGFAITSANKAVACLDIARDAQVISDEEFETLSEGYKNIIIQLKGFIKAIGKPKEATAPAVQAEPVAA